MDDTFPFLFHIVKIEQYLLRRKQKQGDLSKTMILQPLWRKTDSIEIDDLDRNMTAFHRVKLLF